jgi:hypothetical protein
LSDYADVLKINIQLFFHNAKNVLEFQFKLFLKTFPLQNKLFLNDFAPDFSYERTTFCFWHYLNFPEISPFY